MHIVEFKDAINTRFVSYDSHTHYRRCSIQRFAPIYAEFVGQVGEELETRPVQSDASLLGGATEGRSEVRCSKSAVPVQMSV